MHDSDARHGNKSNTHFWLGRSPLMASKESNARSWRTVCREWMKNLMGNTTEGRSQGKKLHEDEELDG